MQREEEITRDSNNDVNNNVSNGTLQVYDTFVRLKSFFFFVVVEEEE